ncbi:head assembly [Klebsiella phage vB_KpnP_IL33]|uniref:Capsid assembly protein n=1 Tax=Klebsiella phage vB_KpnP_IL33 TaxID=1907783 RepID=A0A1V0E6G6_9CAUD|nr:head assembly [Klebsiella phage vB_KpnP_IL33]ARB12443.1 capsid assembly protein [Klebsiella phage vB_KpnP_IL33]
MAGESNADVYASFGVNSAVLTGSTPEEHQENMLALDVAARDGDDAIELNTNSDDPYGSGVDPFGEQDEGRMQVRISADGSDDTEGDEHDSEEQQDDEESQSEEVTTEGEDEEFKPIGETPADINEASQQLEEHEAGFNDMVATATERGLSQDAVTRIQQEYQNEDSLSEESYRELAEAGYSKAFVDAYIRGQEALVNQYVEKVMDFVGGRERFQQVYGHMKTNNPEGAEALIKAFESRDVATMKTILNLAGQSRDKTFGKKAERSIAKRATPAKPVARKAEGFESQAEMIKAMSDPRYRTDSKYRREVEQKVIDSKF